MPTGRVILHAEQEGRSFKWLLSRDMAERLAAGLREKGWTVTVRAEDGEPKPREDD